MRSRDTSRWRQAILLPALVAASAASAAEPGAHVALPEHVQVRRADVRLGDIAKLRSRDLSTLRQLMALPIGPAPRPGEATVLDARTISRFVQVRLKLPETAVEWEGAPRIRIERAMQSLLGDRLAGAAKRSLEEWLHARYERFTVATSQDIGSLVVPAGDVELRVRDLPENQLPGRRMVMWLDVWVGGDFVRTVAVPFDVTVYQQAWVARRDVRAGEMLHAAAFERREINVAGLTGSPVQDLTEGLRTRRGVLTDTALMQAAVEAAPAVLKGQTVTLRSRSGAIALEARAEVLQDGWPGGRVRVSVPASKETLLARVVGAGLVELSQ